MDLRKKKPSPNFTDLTGVSGEGPERLRLLKNFLDAFLINRHSAPGKEMVGAPDAWAAPLWEDKKYKFQPVESPIGNLLKTILTSRTAYYDSRQSVPVDEKSPIYREPWILDQIKQGSSDEKHKLKPRYYK
jgi:hypothetical protein